jgi:hypothetical protein
MFGNSLGWSISGLLVVAMIGLLVGVQSIARPTPATGFSQRAEFSEELKLPISAGTVLGSRSGEAGVGSDGAAALYGRAVEVYGGRPDAYLMFAKTGRVGGLADVEPALAILRDAAGLVGELSPRLFAKEPKSVVGYRADRRFEDLATLGRCAARAGLVQGNAGNWQAAVGDLRAAFALGVMFYNERLTYYELSCGLELMARGTAHLAEAEEKVGDHFAAEAVRQFDAARIRYVNEHVLPVHDVLGAIDQSMIALNAGDVRVLAQRKMPERMWRVEAILKLGRYRFDAGRTADQRMAPRILRRIVQTEGDPVVRAAAEAALGLTIEEYRTIQ